MDAHPPTAPNGTPTRSEEIEKALAEAGLGSGKEERTQAKLRAKQGRMFEQMCAEQENLKENYGLQVRA